MNETCSKKSGKLVYVLLIAVITAVCVFALAGCSNLDIPDGVSEDARIFKPLKDERKFADAGDYKGYFYKKDGKVMPFRMKCPEQISESRVYPLVIFLHGMGDWGDDNTGQMYRSLITSVEKYVGEDCFVILPQTPKNEDWTDDGAGEIYNSLMDDYISTEYPVDKDRIYLTGMSMGGMGTFYQALKNPDKYAAIMPVCGYVPTYDLAPIRDLPIWLGHSEDDDAVSVLNSRFAFAELQRLGNTDAHASWFEDKGHQVTQAFYDQREIWEWLFSRTK